MESYQRSNNDVVKDGLPTIDEQRSFLISISRSFTTICEDAIERHYTHDFFRSDIDGKKRLYEMLIKKDKKFSEDLAEKHNDLVKEEVWKVIIHSRGPELPGFMNSYVIQQLFQNYSSPWEEIARNHVKDVWITTINFLDSVLRYLTKKDVSDNILRCWLEPMMNLKLEAAYVKLNEILDVHIGSPFTINPDFVNMMKVRVPKMDLAEDIIDITMAYAEIALSRFKDLVPALAIRLIIVRKIPEMLTEHIVSRMPADVLMRIFRDNSKTPIEIGLTHEDTMEQEAKSDRQYDHGASLTPAMSSSDSENRPRSEDCEDDDDDDFAEWELARSRATETEMLERSMDFYKNGREFFKNKKYREALGCFNSALSTLENIENLPILPQLVDIQYYILETHISLDDSTIEQAFVNKAYITAAYAEKLRRTGLQPRILTSCALISLQLGNIGDAVFFAEKLDSSFVEAETIESRVAMLLMSRINDGYFPPIAGIQYGEVKSLEANGKCMVCSELASTGQKYALVTACSHLFHQSCLQACLSDQFRSPALRASFGHLPTSSDAIFAEWILKEHCPSDFMVPTDGSSGSCIPVDAELKCPHCSGKIDYASMKGAHCSEWVGYEHIRWTLEQFPKSFR